MPDNNGGGSWDLRDCAIIVQRLFAYLNDVLMVIASSVAAYRLTIYPFESDFFRDVGNFFLPFLLFLVVLGVLKWLVLKIENQEKQVRISMMIAAGGISIGALASKIVIFMDYPGINDYAFFLFVTTTSLFHITFFIPILFNTPPVVIYKDSNISTRGYRILLILNIIAFVVTMRIASCLIPDRKRLEGVFLFHSWSSILMASSIMDFFGLAVSFWDFAESEAPAPVQRAPDAAPVSQNSSTPAPAVAQHTPECKICTFAYSTSTRIPRILTECYHTICQDCAGKLLAQNGGKIVICPFCQTATAVNGPVERLPKNFAVMDIMDNLR